MFLEVFLPCDYPSLDNALGGFMPGQYVVIAGRPGHGKTTLALNMARRMALKGKPVGFISLEMSGELLTESLIAAEAGVEVDAFKRGFGAHEAMDKIRQVSPQLEELPLFIYEASHLSPVELISRALRLKGQHGIEVLFVDYLQLMVTGEERRRASLREQVTEISREIKLAARRLAIPVVALCQLNREPDNRPDHRPRLSDLRESGAIEQDADVVLLVFREPLYWGEEELRGMGLSCRDVDCSMTSAYRRSTWALRQGKVFAQPYERESDTMSEGEKLQDFVTAFDRLGDELDRARDQSVKPKHLWESTERVIVQAGQLSAAVIGADALPQGSGLKYLAELLRLPKDERAGGIFWKMGILPWLVAKKEPGRLKPRAGSYDWPKVATDAEGKVLGKDGKPLKGRWLSKEGKVLKGVDPKKPPQGSRWELVGEPKTIIDDFDEADLLYYLCERCNDHADACRFLAQLLRRQAGAETTALPEAAPRAQAPSKTQPTRLWSRDHCPSCGVDGIEFLTFSNFSKRSRSQGRKGVDRETVSRRVRRGTYWADANRRVPWCQNCKEKTPEGEGVEQPVESPHIDDYALTKDDRENMYVWAETLVCEKFPDFDRELPGTYNEDDAHDYEREAYSVALAAIGMAMRESQGDLTRDQGEGAGRRALQDFLNRDYRSRFIESRGSPSDLTSKYGT